ncbi:MAG: hypothetical protein C0608_02950 [Deltaproteobacteria bacterium]|nr:MAG: hypothetical protein C0608_02950 [Deltaproteobacteria bacterium]
MKRILEGLRELFLPGVCRLCGKECIPAPAYLPKALDDKLCESCAASLAPYAGACCEICSLPFMGEGPSHLCPQCEKSSPLFDHLSTWGIYSSSLREAIIAFKYNGDLKMRGLLSGILIETLKGTWGESSPFDSIVPVPPTSKRLKERGYDLPSYLTYKASKEWGVKWRPKALFRREGGGHVAGLPLKERWRAVRGLYTPREKLSGWVLIVDDVATSLATLRACARCCLDAGAEGVSCATLARTPVTPSKGS